MFCSDFAGLARIATAAVTLLTSSAAVAAHFDFQVPYEFHKMGPDVSHLTIQCVVFDESNQSVGSGYKTVTINRNTGEAVGTVSIPVNADADKSAYNARSYRCRITLMAVIGANPPQQHPGTDNPGWQFQPDTTAPFVQEVTGTLPGSTIRNIQPIAPKARLLRQRVPD